VAGDFFFQMRFYRKFATAAPALDQEESTRKQRGAKRVRLDGKSRPPRRQILDRIY
jgi:hypothetical protein